MEKRPTGSGFKEFINQEKKYDEKVKHFIREFFNNKNLDKFPLNKVIKKIKKNMYGSNQYSNSELM